MIVEGKVGIGTNNPLVQLDVSGGPIRAGYNTDVINFLGRAAIGLSLIHI